jgi:hypothetical protein
LKVAQANSAFRSRGKDYLNSRILSHSKSSKLTETTLDPEHTVPEYPKTASSRQLVQERPYMLEKAVGVLTLCAMTRIRMHDQVGLLQLFYQDQCVNRHDNNVLVAVNNESRVKVHAERMPRPRRQQPAIGGQVVPLEVEGRGSPILSGSRTTAEHLLSAGVGFCRQTAIAFSGTTQGSRSYCCDHQKENLKAS